MTSPLYQRIRSQCCDFSGLTPAQLDEHAHGIERMVLAARRRNADAEPTVYLGYQMLVTSTGVEVYDWVTGSFTRRFKRMSSARQFVRAQRKVAAA